MQENLKENWDSLPEWGNEKESRSAFAAFKERASDFSASRRPAYSGMFRFIRGAAAVLFVPLLIFSIVLLSRKEPASSLCELTVPAGQRDSLTLPDGTSVWLNSGSSIVWPERFMGDSRQVIITGEGYFDVARDPKHPFILKAGNMSVEVLGTVFNVSSYQDMKSASVSLIEGSVRMSVDHDGMKSQTVMKPGEMVCYDKQSGHLTKDNVHAESVCAWRNGGFSFTNQPLSDIVAQLQRVFSVRIDVMSSELLESRFSMAFVNGEGLDSILKAISDVGKMRLVRKDDTYIIL